MGIRSEIVSELGWRFGKLAAWAVDQSKLAPSVAAMAGTAAERPTLALVGFINGPFFAVHGSGGDDPQRVCPAAHRLAQPRMPQPQNLSLFSDRL